MFPISLTAETQATHPRKNITPMMAHMVMIVKMALLIIRNPDRNERCYLFDEFTAEMRNLSKEWLRFWHYYRAEPSINQ